MALSDIVINIEAYLDKLSPENPIDHTYLVNQVEECTHLVYEITGLTEETIGFAWDDPDAPPFVVAQYIKYQIVYDNVLQNYLSRINTTGKSETLGDYKYTNSNGISTDYKYLVDNIKDKLNYWEKKMLAYFSTTGNGSAAPNSASRCEAYETYPFTTRNSW